MLSRRRLPVRSIAAAVAVAALSLPLAGCTGSSKAASSASPSASATLTGPRAQSASAGITLQLPAGWQQVPLGNGQQAKLHRLFHDTAQVARLSEQMRVGQFRGVQVFAVQPRGNQRPGTLSVAIAQASSSTLDALEKELLIGTTSVAATKPAFDRVRLPAGESLRVHYRLTDGDSTTQYYVLAGPLAFTLTVTTPDRDPNLAVNDAVARSMHLTNAA